MKLIQKLSNSAIVKPNNLVSFASILAVVGPVIILTGGIWDAYSHTQKEPELFWTIQHVSVYTGVSLVTCAGIIGGLLLIKKSASGILKKGIQLVIIGSIIQLISGSRHSTVYRYLEQIRFQSKQKPMKIWKERPPDD